jgi:nucleotide-binding universal stress UspA family protein
MSQTKRRFSRILVAIDGSEAAMRAAEYATSIPKKEDDGQLIALTVVELTKLGYSSFVTTPTPLSALKGLEKKRGEAKNWLEKAEELAKQNNISFKSDIIEEAILKVGTTIVKYAEQHYIELIVVGTRGKSGFKKLLIGSVASDVVSYAQCPVMVVK